MKPLAQRFWDKVSIQPEGCWLWTGACNTEGYGEIGDNGKTLKAHRVAWELANGFVPDNLQVLHHCDKPSCVNPSHLFLGTQADNIEDAVKKGHMLYKPERHTRHMNRKETSILQEKARGTHKRNEEIRKLAQAGQNFAQIARRYSLTRQAVRAIVRKHFNEI